MAMKRTQAQIDMSRIRRYGLSNGALKLIFSGRVEIVAPDMPEDISIHHIAYDFAYQVFYVFVHSMSFDPVADGSQCPSGGELSLRHVEGA